MKIKITILLIIIILAGCEDPYSVQDYKPAVTYDQLVFAAEQAQKKSNQSVDVSSGYPPGRPLLPPGLLFLDSDPAIELDIFLRQMEEYHNEQLLELQDQLQDIQSRLDELEYNID